MNSLSASLLCAIKSIVAILKVTSIHVCHVKNRPALQGQCAVKHPVMAYSVTLQLSKVKHFGQSLTEKVEEHYLLPSTSTVTNLGTRPATCEINNSTAWCLKEISMCSGVHPRTASDINASLQITPLAYEPSPPLPICHLYLMTVKPLGNLAQASETKRLHKFSWQHNLVLVMLYIVQLLCHFSKKSTVGFAKYQFTQTGSPAFPAKSVCLKLCCMAFKAHTAKQWCP